MLSVRAVVVLHEHHFQLVSHCRIVVDHPGHPVDIADDGLCPGIAGGGLGTEQIDGGMEVGQAALLQTEVKIHNRQDVQQLPLVLMQTLDLYVKNEVRVQHHTLMLGNHRAQLLFLQPLDGIEPGNSLIIDLVLQLADDIQILQEVAANQLPDHFGQFRVAQANPAAGRDAVGLILEPIGIDTVPVVEAVVLQNLGVDLGNAVDIGAHIHGQVGHMGHVVPDNEQVGMLLLQLGVNAADDVHNLRHHGTHQIQGPLLQGLAHDGVVGVGEGLLGHIKSLLKAHALQHQQPDQLGNGHCRVGIVQLDRIIRAELGQIVAVRQFEGPQHILQGSGRQHILLLDPQPLAFPGGVVGVQDPGNVLSLILGVQGTQIVLIVECVEIQFLLGLALPQAQGSHVVGVVADNRHVVRHRQNGMLRELDLHRVIIAAVGPGITELGPVIRLFHLAAVAVKALLEQAELVAQTVAGQGDIGRSRRIQEAGCQTAQAAIAQSIVLNVLQHSQIHAPLGKQLLHLIQNAQIEQVAVNQPANQVLGGDVVSFTLVHPGLLGVAPVVGNGHHHSLAQSLMEFLRRGISQGNVIGILQLRFRPFQNVYAIQIHIRSPFLEKRFLANTIFSCKAELTISSTFLHTSTE